MWALSLNLEERKVLKVGWKKRVININFTNLKVGIRGKGARRHGRFP